MAQSIVPVATWGLTVTPNDEPEPAFDMDTEPGTLQLTMAAIDPDEDISQNEGAEAFKKPRATIKMIVLKDMDEDEDDSEDDDEDLEMADLLDDDDDEAESPNGEGPSDPKRSPKQMKKDALMKALDKDQDDVLANGAKAKGKAKAAALEDMDDDEEDDDEEMGMPEGAQEYVLCTLDPDSHYNQPLNITIPRHEQVAFRVTGTHSIHLTGNIVVTPADDDTFGSETSEDEDEDVDLSPDEDELDLADEDDESDELDDMEDPRVTELGSDEDDEAEAPKLVKNEKANKKRAREDDSSMLDAEDEKKPTTNGILEKALKKEESAAPKVNSESTTDADGKPLSKTQLKKMRKKMKDNAGNAVEVTQTTQGTDEGEKITTETRKESPSGKTKSVQFAEKLEQGPSAATTNGEVKKEEKKDDKKGSKTQNPRTIDGVSIDDKKVGTGSQAKKGDKVSMRYIGKLEDKKQFDANKKGPPFQFKLGSGEVIKGWDIGVQGMAVGGERRITVPAKHAYGSKKLPGIPANSTLIFDVKLLEINAKK